jgi:ribosome-binding protein aMBF1 (putative translation factor)
MIKNEREYKITQSHVNKFRQALDYLAESRENGKFDLSVIDLQKAATESMIKTLQGELKEYEELKSGRYRTKIKKCLDLVESLSTSLIQARITLNWTQKDLAIRVGVSEQQIQRYESGDYETASLATVKKINEVIKQQLLGAD